MKLKIKFVFLLIIISLFISCENILFKDISGIFTASFETNGGTPIENLDCSVIETEPVTTKENFIFAGWYKQPSFKDKITFPYKLTENTKFYAKWLPTYLVSFESNGGTIIPSYRTDVIESLPECSRQDYYFTGWFTNPDLTGNPIGIPYELTCDITLYAKWLPTYFVNFETNGGSLLSSYRTAIIEKSPISIRNDYDFCGWYSDENFENEIIFPYTLTKNTTLYAKWKQMFNVSFDTQGGASLSSYKTSCIESLPITSKQNCIFAGWYTTSDFSGEPISFPYEITEDIKLYAKWIPTYLVSFETNGGSQIESCREVEISELPIPTRKYYNFSGWFIDEQFITELSLPYVLTEDITLYAKWEPIVYQIQYVLNGGTNSPNNPSLYTVEDNIILENASNDTLQFAGWYLEENCVTRVETLPIENPHDIVLYAKFRLFTMIKIPGTNFEMSQTEVTQKLYESVMGENPSYFTNLTHPTAFNLENHPVEYVSLFDAIYFCNKLSIQEGLDPVYYVDGKTDVESWNYTPHQGISIKGTIKVNSEVNGYRLPTRAEWECAALGGETSFPDDFYDDIQAIAWYYENSNKATNPVAQKKDNGYGLYDMFGNVSEWCWHFDGNPACFYCFGQKYDSYSYAFISTYVSYKSYYPYKQMSDVGFRIVRTITE